MSERKDRRASISHLPPQIEMRNRAFRLAKAPGDDLPGTSHRDFLKLPIRIGLHDVQTCGIISARTAGDRQRRLVCSNIRKDNASLRAATGNSLKGNIFFHCQPSSGRRSEDAPVIGNRLRLMRRGRRCGLTLAN